MTQLKNLCTVFLITMFFVACGGSKDTTADPAAQTAPSAPTGVSAVGAEGGIVVNWNSVAGATSYKIYWKTKTDITTSDSVISGLTSTNYAHNDTSTGFTYYYAVTAVNEAGESSLSAEASAKVKNLLGTFSKEVVMPGADSFYIPIIHSSIIQMRSMGIYLATDIKASGLISSIELTRDEDIASEITCPGFTIKMGHTGVTTMSATFADNVEQGKGSFVTVLDNATITIPQGLANEKFKIDLAVPYNYNGVDNLIVEINRAELCSSTMKTRIKRTAPLYNAWVYASGAAASTETTGTVSDYSINMKFNFSGGTNTLNITKTGTNTFPFNDSTKRVQMLYKASEINGAGYITGIAFSKGSITTASSFNITIKMGHTTLDALTTTYAGNFSDTPITVADNMFVNVAANIPAGEYIWIPINDVFKFNGTDNIVLEIETSNITGGFSINRGTLAGTRVYGPKGAVVGDGVDHIHYLAKFRFAGAPVDIITAGSSIYGIPFSNTFSSVIQTLYTGAEIGRSGVITKIAFRLKNDSQAATYKDFCATPQFINS